MKNFKKISAMIMASVITSGAVSAMSAGAFAWVTGKDYMDELVEDAYMIPADGFFYDADESRRIYLADTGNNAYELYDIGGQDADYISASISGNIDSETLEKSIYEICPDAALTFVSQADNSYNLRIAGFSSRYLPYEEARQKDITYEQVLDIYDLLNSTEKLQTFDYHKTNVWYGNVQNSMRTYWNSNREAIDNYIIQNNLDWYTETDETDDEVFIVNAEKELSAEESYNIAKRIYDDLGIHNFIIMPSSNDVSQGTVIDMHNNIDGDANDDGELSLADAISIMQAIGNPDEYTLTPQGAYNADITGNHDGLTNMDALAVQKKLLNLE